MGVVDDQESEQLLGPDPKAEEEEEAKVGDKSDTCSEIVFNEEEDEGAGLEEHLVEEREEPFEEEEEDEDEDDEKIDAFKVIDMNSVEEEGEEGKVSKGEKEEKKLGPSIPYRCSGWSNISFDWPKIQCLTPKLASLFCSSMQCENTCSGRSELPKTSQ